MNIIKRARDVANIYHYGQTRRDGITPYFAHLEGVASILRGGRENSTVIAVAYLHDILEDTNMTVQGLRENGFSKAVIDAVVALTKKSKESYTSYIIRVKANEIARKVKLADISHNLSDAPTAKQRAKYEVALKQLLSKNVLTDFEIEVERSVIETQCFRVTAKNLEEAEELAIEEAKNAEWDDDAYYEAVYGHEI